MFIVLFLSLGVIANSQNSPFQIALEPLQINNLGGLQSYAYGQYNGERNSYAEGGN